MAPMRELRDAIRQWARTPVITLVVVASLALGIGANTAVFSLIDSLLLKPLPVRHAERLVRIHDPSSGNHSIPTFEQFRAGDQLFEAIAAVSLMRPDVSSTAVVTAAVMKVYVVYLPTWPKSPCISPTRLPAALNTPPEKPARAFRRL